MTPNKIAKSAYATENNGSQIGLIVNQNREITMTESDLIMLLERAALKGVQHSEEVLSEMSETSREAIKRKVW